MFFALRPTALRSTSSSPHGPPISRQALAALRRMSQPGRAGPPRPAVTHLFRRRLFFLSPRTSRFTPSPCRHSADVTADRAGSALPNFDSSFSPPLTDARLPHHQTESESKTCPCLPSQRDSPQGQAGGSPAPAQGLDRRASANRTQAAILSTP